MTAFKPNVTLTEQVARHIANLIVFGQLGFRTLHHYAIQLCQQVREAASGTDPAGLTQ